MTNRGRPLDAYRDVTPPGTVDFLLRLADVVHGRRFVHVNSSRDGGGVAEILGRMVPLMNELGVKSEWHVIEGDPAFFTTTKAFHNALQGTPQRFTSEMFDHYVAVNRANARRLRLEGDLVLVHDPQPAALVESRPADGRWVWRCHIDLAGPQREAWTFLRQWVARYDAAIFSLPAFAPRLGIEQFLVYPSIDPLAAKNRPLSRREVERQLATLGVAPDKPLLLQVSRFDRFKDPLGVIAAYRLVKRQHDVRLVLAGGGASDDPESAQVLAEVREAAGNDPDVIVLDLRPDAHLAINALQRAATIVLQKSTREGFGLTVAEAMWKGKPVIGGATGGIRLQVIDGTTGYLVSSPEGAAYRISYLLSNPQAGRRLGANGREHVRQNFLITRHLRDYLSLLVHLGR
ncbi:MAG: glycosyltransferase [Candidatus Rokubacteria bacterium]|nr:glycosyltransferase [Candidatus Rokubacteria bacterium]